MNRGRALILAVTAAFATACASAGGGMEEAETGNRPRDNTFTNSAGVHMAQAGLLEGEQAREHYRSALSDALDAIEADSANPKGYLVAGQAAVELHRWTQADTMFARALELYPPYEEQIISEREQGWVNAYNMAAEAMNAGDLNRSVELFEGADQLYQERPEARMALGSLYLRLNDRENAIEAYTGALEILTGEPPEGLDEEQLARWAQDRQVAAFNAAQLLSDQGDYDDAAAVLQGFLEDNVDQLDSGTQLRAQTALAAFLAQAGEAEEAQALYNQILDREDLTSDDYFQIGIGFFNTGDYDRAAEAFRDAAELNPYSRDALLNLVQSLYSQAIDLEESEQSAERDARLNELYDEILATAEQVRSFDPLNRNLLSFMLRSLRGKAELSDEEGAQELTRQTQELYRAYQDQSYEVSEISLALETEERARVSGLLTNLGGTAGEEVQLEFSVVDSRGNVLDRATVMITAPAEGSAAEFTATVDLPGGDFAGWMYEIAG